VHRVLACLIATIVLLTLSAEVAFGLTVQRTWRASLGTNGVNGSAILRAYAGGTGSLALTFKKMLPYATYNLQIRAGSCSSLGTILARPYPATTDATGAIVTKRTIFSSAMNTIWSVARTKAIAFRVVSGNSIRCGNLVFNKATRIRISSLGIDLPIIRGAGYPKCNVASYLPALWQPREPGVTFIYAHARTGMFLPLLTRSKINNGASLIGMYVRVYTTDSRVYVYRIDKVRRHVTSAQNAAGVTKERLWLQTSEGPNYTYPKLIVEAHRVSSSSTTYSIAHPKAHPVSC
jgi:sortase (surface protein transpeptidase)